MIFDELRPRCDCARHSHRVGAVGGDRRHSAADIPIETCRCRRPARTIERYDLSLAAAHIEDEAIASNACLRRFDDAK